MDPETTLFFGFEGYESYDNLLVSLGLIEVENQCLIGFKEEMGDEFTWLISTDGEAGE